MLDVPVVEVRPIRDRGVAAQTLDRGQSGQSDHGPVSVGVRRELGAELVDELRPLRPRADQAHVPSDHVHQLGQLVDGVAADERAHTTGPVGIGRPLRRAAVGQRSHRAQLEELEPPAVEADPLLPVDHTRPHLQAHGQGGQHHERAQDEHGRRRQGHVDRALDRHPDPRAPLPELQERHAPHLVVGSRGELGEAWEHEDLRRPAAAAAQRVDDPALVVGGRIAHDHGVDEAGGDQVRQVGDLAVQGRAGKPGPLGAEDAADAQPGLRVLGDPGDELDGPRATTDQDDVAAEESAGPPVAEGGVGGDATQDHQRGAGHGGHQHVSDVQVGGTDHSHGSCTDGRPDDERRDVVQRRQPEPVPVQPQDGEAGQRRDDPGDRGLQRRVEDGDAQRQGQRVRQQRDCRLDGRRPQTDRPYRSSARLEVRRRMGLAQVERRCSADQGEILDVDLDPG